MFGRNPKLPPEFFDGKVLKVHSIFYTIQGEGPYSGRPAVFIRLSGCNLACSFCDTEFDLYESLELEQILDRVRDVCRISNRNLNKRMLIVITGGEPFRQRIGMLCDLLIKSNFEVQIETNGLLYNEIPNEVHVICSPKNNGNGYYKIRDDVLRHTVGIKFIVSSSLEGYSNIAEVGQSEIGVPVYVQSMDEYDEEKNRSNIKLAIEIAMKNNAMFSMQLHKIVGME